jgi:predicted alpha/beta superfamily hydrolase
MTILKPAKLIIIAILLLIFSTTVFAQKLEPKERILEPDHAIVSKSMGKEYQLYISFPDSYSTKDTLSYPVLYVLDGKYSFYSILAAKEASNLSGSLEEVIIVGIGSGLDVQSWLKNRLYDYTPTVNTPRERALEKRWGFAADELKSGGATKFLKSLKTEIIPFIDKHYKTNADRGLAGHSQGGLFAAYCLINSDGYFTRFGINSPAFYWDNEKVLNQAVSQFTLNKSFDMPATKVFISVGGNDKSDGKDYVSQMKKFQTSLKNADYENVILNWQIFEGESHVSVYPAMISRTIMSLYGNK